MTLIGDQSRRIRSIWYVARMRDVRNVWDVYRVRKAWKRKDIGRLVCLQEVLGETECEMEWIQLAQGEDQSQTVVVKVINLQAYNRRDVECLVS